MKEQVVEALQWSRWLAAGIYVLSRTYFSRLDNIEIQRCFLGGLTVFFSVLLLIFGDTRSMFILVVFGFVFVFDLLAVIVPHNEKND